MAAARALNLTAKPGLAIQREFDVELIEHRAYLGIGVHLELRGGGHVAVDDHPDGLPE